MPDSAVSQASCSNLGALAGLKTNQRSTFGHAPSVGLMMSARSFCTPPRDPSTPAGHVGGVGRNREDVAAGLDGLDGDGDGNITRGEWIIKYGSAGDAMCSS